MITTKIDEHTHVQKEKLVERPPFPDAIKIEITSRCNLKCSYCGLQKGMRQTGDMPAGFLYDTLDRAKDVGVKEIGLFLNGEPFLVKELPNYIRYAKDLGFYVFITTNGLLCTEKRMIPVMQAGLNSLKFSVNAGTSLTYKELHGIDGLDLVINNIMQTRQLRDAWKFDMKIYASSIYQEKYKAELLKLEGVLSLFVDEFYYLPLYGQAGHVRDSFADSVGNIGRKDNPVPAVPCWGLFNSAKITWDGFLTACYFDHDERFKIADLRKVSLTDAWHDPKFKHIRKCHLDNAVKDCVCKDCLL